MIDVADKYTKHKKIARLYYVLRRVGFKIMRFRLTAVQGNLTQISAFFHRHIFQIMDREKFGKNSEKILQHYFAYGTVAGKIGLTSSLHESNFACYNCISNIKICERTAEKHYQKKVSETGS